MHATQIARMPAVAAPEGYGCVLNKKNTGPSFPCGDRRAQGSVAAADYKHIVVSFNISHIAPPSLSFLRKYLAFEESGLQGTCQLLDFFRQPIFYSKNRFLSMHEIF
jgi:hypothetical protein